MPVSTKVLGHVCAYSTGTLEAGTTRKTTFVGPRFGVRAKFWTPKRGPHHNLLLRRTPFWGPKFGVQAEWCFWSALSKDGFRQQVTQWASACLPVPVSFLFGRHADSCRQLRIFTNWGGPSQRDRFLRRFSDLILGSSRIASFLGRQQVAPWFSGTRIAMPVRVVEINSSLRIEHRTAPN